MRNTNCQNIRREIEEAGSADLLGVAATSHIQGCPACETLSQQQTRLQEILSSLGTVEVPGDFDFRLRARLAGEKRGGTRYSRFNDFSVGLLPVAVAAMLFVIVSVILFIGFRTRAVTPALSKQEAPKVAVPDLKPNQTVIPANPTVNPDQVAVVPAKDPSNGTEGTRPSGRVPKTRGLRNELAAYQGNRFATQDSSSTPAALLKHDDRLAESYPTASFPINASYQSIKVSVDDGRGASRTISLPAVSFGSDRTISQNPSPLMASARGSW